MTINLDTLRKIAEAATPGPWIIDSLESGEHGVFVEEGNPDYRKLGCASAIVASHLVGKNAEYLEAFDPETALALLSCLEQAEQDRVKLRNRLDAMRRQRDGYQNQIRKAEQQVARVREVAAGWATNDRPFREALLRALDGDGRG